MKEIFGVAPSKSSLRDEPHSSHFGSLNASYRNAKSRGTHQCNKASRCFRSNRGRHITFQRGDSSKKRNNRNLACQSRNFKTSYDEFTEDLPENQTFAPEEHDLNELQLRLDALKTSIRSMNQSWRQPIQYAEVSDTQNDAQFCSNQGASRNYPKLNSLSDANNIRDAFDAQFSTSVYRHDLDFSADQWHEEQQRILQAQDPRVEISPKYRSNQFASPSSVSGDISRPLRPFLLPYPEVAGSYDQPSFDQLYKLHSVNVDDYNVKNMEFSSDSEKEDRVDIAVWKPNSSFSEEFAIRPQSCQSNSRFSPPEQRRLYSPDENNPPPPLSSSAQSKVFPFDAYSTSSGYSYSPLLTGKADATDYIFIERSKFGDIDLRRPILLPPPQPPSFQSVDQCYEKESSSSSRSSGATSASLDDITSSKSEYKNERTFDGNVLESVSPAFSVSNERYEQEDDDDDDLEASALREILLKSLENKVSLNFE
uniref:Uncharacterized protein n=1 Tax=Romanomermis culicivorax TaxID=13658 RepID=A0A915IPJ8_ROMCU